MPSVSHKPWIALCAAFMVLGLACSMQDRRPSAPENEANLFITREEPSSQLDTNRDLCLFGRGAVTRDAVFEGRAATNVQQHTTTSEGVDFDPDVDSTGKVLVFASTRHSRFSHLYSKPVGGATLTQITDEPANDTQPSFSPSGGRIAFASDRSGQWDIWVIDANGRNPIQITNNPSTELHPSWSPDGKHLVYCRINPKDDRGELWLVDLDNPGIKRLIGEGLFPEWSPKGDKIAYQRSRARGSRWFSIWTLDIKDNEVLYPTEVASRPDVALIAPTWSPDATQIAFTSVAPAPGHGEPQITGEGRSDIGIVDADGRGFQRLTDGRSENYSPTWSVGGRIYFTAKLASNETIWSIKTFRPAMVGETVTTAGDRRAAAVMEIDIEQ